MRVDLALGVKGDSQVLDEFMPAVRRSDLDLWSKLTDLVERVWKDTTTPPKLPRGASTSLGNGLFELRARGKQTWGRLLYAYGPSETVVLLLGVRKKEDKLPATVLTKARAMVDQLRAGTLKTREATETDPRRK